MTQEKLLTAGVPKVKDASLTSFIRANTGLKGTPGKVQKIIDLLKDKGYEFTTLSGLREKIIRDFETAAHRYSRDIERGRI